MLTHPEVPCRRHSLVGGRWRVAAAVALMLLPVVAHAQPPIGTIVGVVSDSAGARLQGARLELLDSTGTRRLSTSDSLGRFHFGNIAVARAWLVTRRLGFRPDTVQVDGMGGEVMVHVVLPVAVQSLAPAVIVRERRQVYDARLEGFYARQQRGVGHFIGRARIAEAMSSSFTDLLRAEVPGVKIGMLGNLMRAVRLRGSRCPPLIFLDGAPATAGEFDVDMIEVGGLEGIEVYGGMVSVPPEFMGTGMRDRCGVIAVWSRPTEARARREKRASARPADSAREIEQAVADGEVFLAADVDVPAVLDSTTFGPDYPDELFRGGVGGRITAEFVVDTTGAVEPWSIRIRNTSDPRFVAPVRAALVDVDFTPATRGGHRVRQVVVLPVAFEPVKRHAPLR